MSRTTALKVLPIRYGPLSVTSKHSFLLVGNDGHLARIIHEKCGSRVDCHSELSQLVPIPPDDFGNKREDSSLKIEVRIRTVNLRGAPLTDALHSIYTQARLGRISGELACALCLPMPAHLPALSARSAGSTPLDI